MFVYVSGSTYRTHGGFSLDHLPPELCRLFAVPKLSHGLFVEIAYVGWVSTCTAQDRDSVWCDVDKVEWERTYYVASGSLRDGCVHLSMTVFQIYSVSYMSLLIAAALVPC